MIRHSHAQETCLRSPPNRMGSGGLSAFPGQSSIPLTPNRRPRGASSPAHASGHQPSDPRSRDGGARPMESPSSEKPKCAGRRTNGERCTKWPMKGQRVCRNHGGASPQARAAAEVRIQVAEAAKAVATFGLPREVDPRDALLEEVYRTAGAVDWLHEQVQALQAADVVWGVTSEVTKDAGEFPGVDTTRAAEVNVWVRLWQAERAHLVKVCEKAIGAGLEERRVKLAEQQGAMLAGVIKAILGDLDLSAEQQVQAAKVVPFRLRSIAATG